MTRFVFLFISILTVLFGLEMIEDVHVSVVEPFTGYVASVSAALLVPFDEAVVSYGRVLQHSGNGFAVSIEAGCNGVEAMIVLFAAIIAFPATWKQRVTALVLGFFAVQIMNILRIISLFYIGQWNMEAFGWMHLYLWPVMIMLDVLVVFFVYLRWIAQPAEGAAA